jgi:hypothetical protein
LPLTDKKWVLVAIEFLYLVAGHQSLGLRPCDRPGLAGLSVLS